MISNNPAIEYDTLEPSENWFHYWFPVLRWTPSGPRELRDSEESLLKYIKTPSEGFYVNIGKVNGSFCRIWTRRFSPPNKVVKDDIPLVMMHGMGAGIGIWSLNLDSLAKDRVVYAVDLPGFARSSRCNFSSDPEEVEEQYIVCIEQWRKALGLTKINILGHSFGGYLAACYSLKHPENLHRAILADPWGMTQVPTDLVERYNIPLWMRMLFGVLKNFNPLWGLRLSGPIGPRVIPRIRPDLMKKFLCLVGEENATLVSDYLFHCNAHNPTGEAAFHR